MNFPQILVSSVLTLTKQQTRMSKRLLNDISSSEDDEVVFIRNVRRRVETPETNSVDSNSVDSNSVEADAIDPPADYLFIDPSATPVPPALSFPYGSDSEEDDTDDSFYLSDVEAEADELDESDEGNETDDPPDNSLYIVVAAEAPVPVVPVVPVEVQMCIICQEVLESSGAKYSLMCAHVFHTECIELWLRRNPVCPICRAEVTVVTVPEEVRRFPEGVSPTTPLYSVIAHREGMADVAWRRVPNPQDVIFIQ